jgi:hypothetical protein
VVAADAEQATVRAGTSLRVRYEGAWTRPGLGLSTALDLPEAQLQLVRALVRAGEVRLAQATRLAGLDEAGTLAALRALQQRGLVIETGGAGEPRYAVRLGPKRVRPLPRGIWESLGEENGASRRTHPPPRGSRTPGSRLKQLASTRQGRWLLSAGPVGVAFLLAEWMVLTRSASFTSLLGCTGVILVSLLAGVFPVLLLLASRRKGDYVPVVVYRLLGNRALLGTIYIVSLASIFLHGLIIWADPLWRAGALLAGGLIIVMSVVLARTQAFKRRLVVELRQEAGAEDSARFSVVAAGEPVATAVQLEYPDGQRRQTTEAGAVPTFSSLRRVSFEPDLGRHPAARPEELKVWAHKVLPSGDSEGLPELLEVQDGATTKRFDLTLSSGHVLLPMGNGRLRLELQPAQEEPVTRDR